MEIIEAKAGKKFKPGDFAYVRALFQPHRVGMIILYSGTIKSWGTGEKQEVYKVLIGKQICLFNEFLLDPLNKETSYKLSRVSKN